MQLSPVTQLETGDQESGVTIDILETALEDIEGNIHFVAYATTAIVPPLFQECIIPRLPTFTTSLTSTASPSDETAAMPAASGRARGRGGKKGGKGGSGGGGGGDGRGSGGTSASSGVSTGVGSGPAGPTGGGARPAGWYAAQQYQQQFLNPILGSTGCGSGQPNWASRGTVPTTCPYVVQTGTCQGGPCG
ncbi:unnamed protein product [Closterium sp. NIES-53]